MGRMREVCRCCNPEFSTGDLRVLMRAVMLALNIRMMMMAIDWVVRFIYPLTDEYFEFPGFHRTHASVLDNQRNYDSLLFRFAAAALLSKPR
jgi:hypothetical protein